jgi:hypothetical protein
VSGATPGRLRQRDDTASGGEDHTLHRGSSDGVSCTRDDRQQVSSSAGRLSDRLVGDMNYYEAWLRVRWKNTPAAAQGEQPLTRRPWGFRGSGRYGDESAV